MMSQGLDLVGRGPLLRVWMQVPRSPLPLAQSATYEKSPDIKT